MSVLVISFAVKIITALVGVLLIWGFLRVLDKVTGVDFQSKMAELEGTSFALYNGLRLIAICLFIGMTIG